MTDGANLNPREAADEAWVRQRELLEKPDGARDVIEEAKHPRRFRPIRSKDISLSASRPYLVKNILPRDGLIVIWGPPKCGKTFWALDIAMHVALGRKYRSRHVHQGTVLYIASEGERGLSARVVAFGQERLEPGDDPPFYLLSSRVNLVKDVSELIADIRVKLGDQECVLIVIDTLNRSIDGSENKDEDMTAYINAADKLREAFSAAIAIIHHCGVNSDRPRGHTSLRGAVDAQIAVRKDADGHVHTEIEYMKDGPEGEKTSSRLVPINVGLDEDGEIITSLVVEEIAETEQNAADRAAANRPKPKPKPKLSDKQQIALNTLHRALGAHGKPAPPHNHIPPWATVVSVDLWRRFYLQGTSAENGQIEDTRRKALRRAAEALMAKEIIGMSGEMAWIV